MTGSRLIIRADASPAIGTGHAMRCLALAQGWRRAKGDVVYAMAESTPAIEQRLAEESCRIARISGTPGSQDDLDATCALLAAESPAWTVLDGYGFDSAYRAAIGGVGRPCLVIDDNGRDDWVGSDLVLNQNVHATAQMYAKRPEATRLLLGPRYALLRAEFTAGANAMRAVAEAGTRVLVTIGGSDPNGLAVRLVPRLAARLSNAEIRVVMGGSVQNGREAESAVASIPGIQVMRDVRNMAELMAWADLAIAAAGTTCWELCCMGLPAIIVEAAQNQQLLARRLDAMGACVNAGPASDIDCVMLAEQAQNLLYDQHLRREMSRRARRLVDGRGADRVLSFMSAGLRIRAAQEHDCRMLWDWANDGEVRRASFSSEPIAWEQHQEWFRRQLEDPGARLYLVEENGDPVGVVRYALADRRATLSIQLDPKRRGQGLGAKVLVVGVEELFHRSDAEVIDAYVKPDNNRSLELFRSGGFEENGVKQIEGQSAVWFVLKRWEASQ